MDAIDPEVLDAAEIEAGVLLVVEVGEADGLGLELDDLRRVRDAGDHGDGAAVGGDCEVVGGGGLAEAVVAAVE